MKNSFKLLACILITFWVIITGCLLVPSAVEHNILIGYLYAVMTLVFAIIVIYFGVEWLIK
jgi:hypothetical protein